jgi:hypothetical protein
MAFQIKCPFCEKTVTAFPLLRGSDLDRALENDADIEVMHSTDDVKEGDHRWNLTKHEKANLRKTIAEGLDNVWR